MKIDLWNINLTGTYISKTNDVRFDIIQYSCDSVNEMKCWSKSWGEMLWVILSDLLHGTCCGIHQTWHLQRKKWKLLSVVDHLNQY